MKKDPDHNSTDSAEIEALITRIERGQLRDEDAQLLARLLRLLLRLITLLQQKNASLSRLKRLLFGPRSDTRMKTNPTYENDSHNFLHFSNLNISLGAESKINSLCVVQSSRIGNL